MVLISACPFYPIALSFIACKWCDCHHGIWNDAEVCLSVPSCVLSFIGSKWSDCYCGMQDGTDLCLSVLPCCFLIHRE